MLKGSYLLNLRSSGHVAIEDLGFMERKQPEFFFRREKMIVFNCLLHDSRSVNFFASFTPLRFTRNSWAVVHKIVYVFL